MSERHYDATYFGWQESLGDVGAVLNRRKFAAYVKPTDTVLDFGCGNGALLAGLPGKQKIGVDIGEEARTAAAARGITVYAAAADVPAETVDVVISNSALEHVERPLGELRVVYRALRPGGIAVLVVPIDAWQRQRAYDPVDPNHHLYTWTPLSFGNLLVDAGFAIESCRVYTHAWRRKSMLIHGRVPEPVFNLAAWMLAVGLRSRQIHAVARRPHQ